MKTKKRLSFNEWAVKFKVSSLWEETTQEKKDLIERIRNARFQKEMDEYNKKKKDSQPDFKSYGE